MKKILTITLLILLTIGLFVSCNADAIKELFSEDNPLVATSYTVTFDLNGIEGTAPTTQTITSGDKVTKPTDPTDTIHNFDGWYKTKDATTGVLSDLWDFDNDTVTADMTLYANWIVEFVDLGVKSDSGKSLYWATKNLGAANPQDPGDYYMWGATALMYSAVDYSKTDGAFNFKAENPYGDNYENTWDASLGFHFNNVPFADGVFENTEGKRNVFTKYTTLDTYAKSGTPDNITNLQREDDAATAKDKNKNWRTPKYDEFVALVENCVLVWTDNYKSSGNAGYIVYKAKNDTDKGKANMNGTWKMWDGANSKYIANTDSEPTGYSTSDIHIFLPAAGYGNNTTLTSKNTAGCYCSSNLNNTNNNSVGAMNFNNSVFNIAYNFSRNYGFSVRPVVEVK